MDDRSRIKLLAVCHSLLLDFFELACLGDLIHYSVEKTNALAKFIAYDRVQAWRLLQDLVSAL